MRKFLLSLAVFGTVIGSIGIPASAAPTAQPARAVIGLLDQGGLAETVQYNNVQRRQEVRRRQEFRRRQALRRQEFRRRQAARRGYYNRY